MFNKINLRKNPSRFFLIGLILSLITSGVTPVFADNTKQPITLYEGSYTSNESFKIYPEIPMMFSYADGKEGLTFVTGDIAREIVPVSYHKVIAQANIVPNVIGDMGATDSEAYILSARLGAPTKGVYAKGSGLSVNFDIDGKVTFTSYYLDVDKTTKSVWGISYDSSKIDNTFMSQFASYNTKSSLWDMTTTSRESLKIDGAYKVGIQDQDGSARNKVNKTTEYKLAIRGGQITAVNGDTNYKVTLAKSNPDLLNALSQMKLTAPGNSVLDVFAKNEGASLSEQKFSDLAKNIRGVSDIAIGKGWYVEDSTILIVKEYIHEFQLPLVATYDDSVPFEVKGIETPWNKNLFYAEGKPAHTTLRILIKSNDAKLSPYVVSKGSQSLSFMSDSSSNTPFNNRTIDFIVPNLSIVD